MNATDDVPVWIGPLSRLSSSETWHRNSPFLAWIWLEETACLRVGSVEVNRTSVGVVWFSELAKLASLRPLHSDSSEKVRCSVRLGD